MYSYPEIREFSGLYLQANSLTVPDGAMEVAENVVIKNDNIIQKPRGRYMYFNPAAATMNQLFFYKTRLLSAYADKLSYYTDTGSYPNETGSETDLTGVTVAITGTRVARSSESNNNLYITSDNGILKLENYNSNVFLAGAPPALDLSGMILNSSVGPISPDRTVGYRAVFGRRDANDNLILGAPSNIAVVYVPPGGTGVTYTSSGAGPYTVTVTSAGHGLVTGNEIIVSNGTDPDADGVYTVVVTGTDTFTYETVGNPASGTLDYTFTRQIRLEGSIPSQIATGQGWFVQLYRSSQATGNVTPQQDYKLFAEKTLSTAEINNRLFFFTDDVDDILLGAELYTNPNSREGELQANFQPPKAEDIAFYKNSTHYANCQTRHLLSLDIIDTSVIANNDFVEVRVGSVTRRYQAATGVGNTTAFTQSFTNAAGNLQINYTAHGFQDGDQIYIENIVGGSLTAGNYFVISSAANNFEISTTYGGSAVAYSAVTELNFEGVIRATNVAGVSWSRASSVVTVTSAAHNLSSGMTIQVTASAGGSPNVANGNYTITVTGTNTFTFSEVAGASSGTLDYRVNAYMFTLNNTSTSISVQLRTTAVGLVKAINRDVSSLIYANYVSTTIPGQMRFQAKGFTDTIYVRANSDAVGAGFLPALPGSFTTGTQVFSDDDLEPNVLYASKLLEPEAVPLVNRFEIGSRSKAILRIMPLRDSVIIVKEDGLFRLTGDTPAGYTITVLDATVICVAASSAKLLNNEVILLSNQGVCRISESSVQIVSRRIDDSIQPILGADTLSSLTSAIAYETERLYFLTTLQPGSDSETVTHLYNVLNNTWTTSTMFIRQGIIGPGDQLFHIDSSGDLMKERKTQTRLDFCGQNTTVTVVSVASDLLSAVITSSAVIEEGDIIVKNNVFSRVETVTGTVPTFTVTLVRSTNLAPADTPILYKRIVSTIKMSPFHGGQVGRMKQFSQMQLQMKDENFSRSLISFTGYTYGGSEAVDWKAWEVNDEGGSSGGWGFAPWGFFPWGQEDGIAVTIGTQPAPVCRIYVPQFQQRTTFIQPVIVHSQAGEAINIQALNYAVRSYNERVSR